MEDTTNLLHTRTQEKGAVSSQGTEPDLAVCVQDSLTEEEVWVRGTEHDSAGISPFEGGCLYHNYPCHSLALGQTTGREHINRKLD